MENKYINLLRLNKSVTFYSREIKKKPVFNIQEKTQEKIKLKQQQNEQANKQHVEKQNTDKEIEPKPSGTNDEVTTQNQPGCLHKYLKFCFYGVGDKQTSISPDGRLSPLPIHNIKGTAIV